VMMNNSLFSSLYGKPGSEPTGEAFKGPGYHAGDVYRRESITSTPVKDSVLGFGLSVNLGSRASTSLSKLCKTSTGLGTSPGLWSSPPDNNIWSMSVLSDTQLQPELDWISPMTSDPVPIPRKSSLCADSEPFILGEQETEGKSSPDLYSSSLEQHHHDHMESDDYDSTEMIKKLFVGKIPKGTTNEDVLEFFSTFGEVENVDVNGDRGCCFVSFVNVASVEDILQKKNVRYLTLNGCEVCVRRYVVIEKDKVFVRGLAPDTSKEELFNYFRQFGRIDNVTLHKNKSGAFPFGFVRFANKKSVNQIMARNDHAINGKTIHCLRAHRQDGKKDKMDKLVASSF